MWAVAAYERRREAGCPFDLVVYSTLTPPPPPPRAPGAALGVAIAGRAAGRRTVLMTGEGSHQLTIGAVGTMGQQGLKPVILLLNNAGYMIERALDTDANRGFNTIAQWNYAALPAALGCSSWHAARAATLGELGAALATAGAAGSAGAYIEIVGGKYDLPPALAFAHKRLGAIYGGGGGGQQATQ